MGNIMINFLGTNRYKECNYCFEGKEKISNVMFVQDAMARIFCRDWNKNDRIVVFLTNEAKENNWLDDGHRDKNGQIIKSEGLHSRLKKMTEENIISCSIETVNIPSGNSEDEIWQIFAKVFEQIKPNDRVIFDITHGFRSLPMLGIVLLNYARFLKNIDIAGIYYGAFEVLGPGYKVEKMPLEERNAPIFDLTSFTTVQEWSAAADNFVNYGLCKKISQQLAKLPKTEENDTEKLALQLEKLSLDFTTVRGPEIIDASSIEDLCEDLRLLGQQKVIPAPIQPLLNHIIQKIETFKKNDVSNGLKAAKWCLDHDLIQQGLTILQEFIVSLLLDFSKKDYLSKTQRELVSSTFYIAQQGWQEQEEKWGPRKLKTNEKNSIKNYLHCPLVEKLKQEYSQLSELRNDINHAGYRKNAKNSQDFKQELARLLDKIQEIITLPPT